MSFLLLFEGGFQKKIQGNLWLIERNFQRQFSFLTFSLGKKPLFIVCFKMLFRIEIKSKYKLCVPSFIHWIILFFKKISTFHHRLITHKIRTKNKLKLHLFIFVYNVFFCFHIVVGGKSSKINFKIRWWGVVEYNLMWANIIFYPYYAQIVCVCSAQMNIFIMIVEWDSLSHNVIQMYSMYKNV